MSTNAQITRDRPVSEVLPAVVGLGVTQMIGWGSTFSPLTIFAEAVGGDLGLTREAVFAGMTAMLLVSGALAPTFGRRVDRLGARRIMVAGSVIMALAMVAMSQATGVYSYAAAWMLCGIASPMTLTTAVMPGLVQVVGPNARRAITALSLISGLTSTLFLPLSTYLLATIGWRNAFLLYAAMHLVICLPIHYSVLSAGPRAAMDVMGTGNLQYEGSLPAERRLKVLVLIAIWSCLEGFLTWGLYVQVIDVLKGHGLSLVAAVAVWSIVGPCQAGARLAELMFGGRYSIWATAIWSAALTPIGLAVALGFGVGVTTATIFAVCLGVGHGLFAVARNVLPLTLFGMRDYGAYMGRLQAPQNLINAAAPIIVAAVLGRIGPHALLWVVLATTTISFGAVLLLVRTCRQAVPDQGDGGR